MRAEAGIHMPAFALLQTWMPASAGMTNQDEE
jgi:hypothetical protein